VREREETEVLIGEALITLLSRVISSSSESASRVGGLSVACPVGLEPATGGDVSGMLSFFWLSGFEVSYSG
jgi:hypothetical protein